MPSTMISLIKQLKDRDILMLVITPLLLYFAPLPVWDIVICLILSAGLASIYQAAILHGFYEWLGSQLGIAKVLLRLTQLLPYYIEVVSLAIKAFIVQALIYWISGQGNFFTIHETTNLTASSRHIDWLMIAVFHLIFACLYLVPVQKQTQVSKALNLPQLVGMLGRDFLLLGICLLMFGLLVALSSLHEQVHAHVKQWLAVCLMLGLGGLIWWVVSSVRIQPGERAVFEKRKLP